MPKHDIRVEAYGTVDEANAVIGAAAAAHARKTPRPTPMLARIQNDLFDVGADLCVPGEAGDRLRLTDAPGARLEAEIAAMNAGAGAADQLRAARRHPSRGSSPTSPAPSSAAPNAASRRLCRHPGR